MSAASPEPPDAPGGGEDRVLTTRAGAVAWVTLSHPGRMNALTMRMWRELADTMRELSADDGLRAVVLRGEGRNFAAGADIREFPDARRDLASVQRYHLEVLAPALHAVRDCPVPVVARLQGACVGGGLEIASLCDLRLAGASTRVGVPINRLGFSMAPDEMQGLLDLAGHAVAMELLLEGQVLDAGQALARGLLTRVVPDEDLDSEIERCLRRLQQGAPLAARLNKQIARRLRPAAPALSADELRASFAYADTRDHREGVRAFLAGAAPHFTGD